jgi:hypothetical protein
VNLLAAVVIGRVDEANNAVMMSSAVFLIAATVIRWALSAHPAPDDRSEPAGAHPRRCHQRGHTVELLSGPRRDPRPRLHARCNPRFELIGLATIDLDGVITVVHPFARDECETPAVPAAAERLHDRRTQ